MDTKTQPQNKKQRIPQRSSGLDLALPLQGLWVRSLVGELGSHKLCNAAIKRAGEENKMQAGLFTPRHSAQQQSAEKT